VTPSPNGNTHFYTGHERDTLSSDNFNQDYMHFRYYGAGMGRFMKPDSTFGNAAANPQGFNLYSYVHGNPVNRNDPTGHKESPAWNFGTSEADKKQLQAQKSAWGVFASIPYGVGGGSGSAIGGSGGGGAGGQGTQSGTASTTTSLWSAPASWDFHFTVSAQYMAPPPASTSQTTGRSLCTGTLRPGDITPTEGTTVVGVGFMCFQSCHDPKATSKYGVGVVAGATAAGLEGLRLAIKAFDIAKSWKASGDLCEPAFYLFQVDCAPPDRVFVSHTPDAPSPPAGACDSFPMSTPIRKPSETLQLPPGMVYTGEWQP
jgi:RHS repeat-associated protein